MFINSQKCSYMFKNIQLLSDFMYFQTYSLIVICTHIYIYICIHIYIYIFINIFSYIYMDTCFVFIYIYICVCVHVRFTYRWIYKYKCMYINVKSLKNCSIFKKNMNTYLHLNIPVCIYIWYKHLFFENTYT